MKTITANTFCEVLAFENNPGFYRLYCDELSEEREQEIINLDLGKVISKCTTTEDGALRIDYKIANHKQVMEYFKRFTKPETNYGK